jgi:hypothetical protein
MIIREKYVIANADEGDNYIEEALLFDRTFDSVEKAETFLKSQLDEWAKDEGFTKEDFEIVKITTIYERNFSKIP